MPSNTTAIWILCGTFVGFLLLRFPVALVLVLSSIATLWYLEMPIVVVAQQTLQGINAFSLLAIPFFILTGQLLGAGGLANRIIDFANVFVGRLPGGLSIVNSVACMFFGNLSGSAIADTSAIGSVMIPVMKKKGYSAEYAVGVTISSAIQGVVVPPSHNLVLYSIVATGVVGGLSVGKLFMAGIVPGFLLLTTLCIVGVVISIRRNYPKGDPVDRKQIPAIIFNGFLSLTPAFLILGSIIGGLATATEAGALAVVYSFCLGFFGYRELKPRHLWPGPGEDLSYRPDGLLPHRGLGRLRLRHDDPPPPGHHHPGFSGDLAHALDYSPDDQHPPAHPGRAHGHGPR